MPEHQQLQQSKNPKPTYQNQATHVSQTPVSNPFSIIQRARINPKSLTHADVMQLQRTIGNRAVGMLLSGIGNTSTAQQITVQRQEIPEEEELLQGKFEDKPEIACPSCFAATIVQRQEIAEEEEPLQTKRENNTGMPDNLKAGVENFSGIDMSDVRVHYNSDKPAGLGALAYTQGISIHVAPGQEKHLPHEAWHVVQQAQGRVKSTMQLKNGIPVNDDKGLEHEADVMGNRAYTSGQTPSKTQMKGNVINNDLGLKKEADLVEATAQRKLIAVTHDKLVQRQVVVNPDGVMRNPFGQNLNIIQKHNAQASFARVTYDNLWVGPGTISGVGAVRVDVQGPLPDGSNNIQAQMNNVNGHSTISTIHIRPQSRAQIPPVVPQKRSKQQQTEIERKARNALNLSLNDFNNNNPRIYIVSGPPSS